MAKAAVGSSMVGYCRVSSSGQARSGLGLEAQKAAINAAADREGWAVVAWQVDAAETGKNTDRPAFRAAMWAIADGEADGLVAAKLDRVCRSVIDFAELLAWFTKADRALVVLDPAIDTSTASGRLVANVFAAVAEWEADVIADRTSVALQAKRASGQAISRPSVLDDEALLARVRAMREAGMSMAAIAAQLDADDVPTVRGGLKWRVSSVQAALGYKRPAAARKAADLPPVPRRRGRAKRRDVGGG
jgi:DNA invertase Pin-like site-specific DNA recombinase